jgi:signal transduction histidine kinase
MRFPFDENDPAYPIVRDNLPYIFYPNVQSITDKFKGAFHEHIFSWIAIPLYARGKLIGFFTLDGFEINKFTEAHAKFALTFANQVAITLENSRLYTKLQSELEERERLIEELERKNADLKSPLITISGFLGQLKDDIAAGNTDRIEHDSQRIQNAVEKMHQLLKELLELSRIGRLMNPPKPVPFESLAREALVLVHGQLELRGVTFTLGQGLPIVHGDRQRLIEVLQNLIDNAVKFMGDQADPHIEIGQEGEEDGKPIFFVQDNGIGVSPEYHERIFGLFDKLNAKSDGTGIGLALVKRIVEFHGGRIWVESEAGKGSTFFFTLPRSTE